MERTTARARRAAERSEVDHPLLEDRDDHEIALGLISRRRPMRGAHVARIEQAPLVAGVLRQRQRPSAGTQSRRPGDLRERLAEQVRAVLPVEYVVEAIAIRPEQPLLGVAALVVVDEHRNLVRAPVLVVVWHELKMPGELAGGAP